MNKGLIKIDDMIILELSKYFTRVKILVGAVVYGNSAQWIIGGGIFYLFKLAVFKKLALRRAILLGIFDINTIWQNDNFK